jgi:pimeloyl-ACP methyl ester carboxylesterase
MPPTSFLRFRSLLTIMILVSMLSVPFLSISSAGAQTSSSSSASDKDSPPPDPAAGISAQAGHYGSSPFMPPEQNDATFVVDVAPGLDTGCTFRGGGPLFFDINVNRYPGDVRKLLANGIAGVNAVLRMPAYDIDYYGGGSGFNPERDRVSINGRTVPTEYLTGDNNVWKLNAFNIPLEWLNFPTDPGDGGRITPAKNTVRIDIDTANSDEYWCMAIDWAALSIEVPRPVFMAHGILSDGSTWSMWTAKLADLGIPSATIDNGKLDSIQNNARRISDRVNTLRQRWGVNKVNILAHSKGGLDSRQYVENSNTVSKLVQLGTPNAGSPLADAIQRGSIAIVGIIGTAVIDTLAGAASYQLTTPYMGLYNSFHGFNPDVKYTSLAGDYRFGGWGVVDTLMAGFYGGRSDTIVPVWSVHALGYASHLSYRSEGGNKEAQHTSLTGSSGIYNQIKPLLTERAAGAGVQGVPTTAGSVSSSATASASEPVATAPVVGTISQGQTKTQTIYIDGNGPATFMLYYGTGNLDLTLTSPSGVRVDPAVASTNSNVDFQSFGDVDGLRHELYSINNPEVGNWTLSVAAPSVVNASGQEPYYLTGFVSNSPITLQAATNQVGYRNGAPIVIRATIQGAPAASSADVTAKVVLPDESFSTITLSDNGSGDDTVAGDGIYAGRFSTTTQAGMYRVLVNANGRAPALFSRSALLIAPVSASASQLSGSYSELASDTDGDGLYNELAINVGVNISQAATYRVLGVLKDRAGNEIATTTTSAALQAGTQSVRLKFSGDRIFEQGVDGPYSLSLVRLAEENGAAVLPLDERANVYSTAAYRHEQFEHDRIYVPGTGRDRGIDTDGNGRFDQLEVTINLSVATRDYYRWSGHLVDRNGTELGFLSGAGTLNNGQNTITFIFNGETIGRNGVSGPYSLNDLLIYSNTNSAAIFHAYTTTAYSVNQFEGAPTGGGTLLTDASVSPTPNAAGWNRSNVQVTLSTTGGTNGVRHIVYSASGSQPIAPTTVPGATAQIPITGEGMTTITFYAQDNAGNQEQARTVTVKLDKTPPTVSYSGNAGSYTIDQAVTITCAATDEVNGSGLAADTCENVNEPAYSFPLGATTLSATADDVAGNRGTGTTTFNVAVTYSSLCNLTGQFLAASKPQLTTSYCAKLNAAEAAAKRRDATAKAGAVNAYKNDLAAQSGKSLTANQVTILAQLADNL